MAKATRPANLQVPARPAKRKTVKDVAGQVQMSERNVYKWREIMRLGREDLLDRMNKGELSLHAAWKLARGKTETSSKKSTRDALREAFAAATLQEQGEFIAEIWDMIEEDAAL